MTQLPDDTFVTSSFKLVNTNEVPELDLEDNRILLESSVTDQNGNITQQYSDISGNIVAVAKRDRNLNLLTKTTYEYDLLGQMLKAYDAQKNPVSVKYDLLGRTISLASVDGGEKRYYYDGTPNLMREDDSRLREENRNIVYKYDGLNRLVEINFVSGDKTVFEYGTLADKIDNLCGRLKSITEKGTSVYYKYGLLGQVEEETRNITAHVVSSVNKEKSATMKYTSDYLGRMQEIIYPDGEVVTYSYDFGGQIYKVTGEKQGEIFDYVNNIGYNEFGQRVYIEYGNGVKTTYTYDPARQWLQNIVTTGSDNILLQNIDYVFDGVGNIMSYTNNCLENGNYSTTQNYEYDNLYQLTKAGGTTILNRYKTSVPDYTSCYEQNFAFDNLGNMTSKGSREWMLNGTKPSSDLNYSFEYNYAEGYVHRLKNAGNRYYEYDPNGNLIREYDSNGAGESEMLSKVQLLSSDDSDSTVYGTEGAWGFGIETSPVKTGINNFERTYIWDDKNRLVQTKDAFYTTNYVYNSNDERVAKYTDRSETLYFNNFWSWHTDPANIYSQGQLSKHIYLGDTRIVTKVSQEVDNTIGGEKQRVFYYHTDHLESASLVTDYRGNEYERLEYTPYGELWVDLGGYTEGTYIPFKFSAKEMDEETGLYYFGARYLDPKYSMWISADPALGEYIPQSGRDKNEQLPGMGGVYTHINFHLYHYAGNNPIKYVDPDGRLFFNKFEAQFVKEVLGNKGLDVYYTSVYIPLSIEDRSASLPFAQGIVCYDTDTFCDPIGNDPNTFIHELFHQIQYDFLPISFVSLIKELLLNKQMENVGKKIGVKLVENTGNSNMSYKLVDIYDGKTLINYTYQYDESLESYNSLRDLPFYEAQAQFVGDFAEDYYNARYGGGLDIESAALLKRKAEIMSNSGFRNTEAVKWILNEL